MNSPASPPLRPTPSQAELLGELLDQMLAVHGGVPYYKFRSVHKQQWLELDGMEAEGWLKRDNDLYFVHSTILPEIDTPAARERLTDIERIYAALSIQYMDTLQAPCKVTDLAAVTGLAPDVVVQVLRHMLDTVIWHTGSSLDVPLEDAFVCPAEKILQFDSFAELAGLVRSWRREPNFFPAALFDHEPVVVAPVIAEPRQALTPLVSAWPPVRSCLQDFKFDAIKDIAGLAGFDVTAAADLVQGSGTMVSKGQLLAAIDSQLRAMDEHHRQQIPLRASSRGQGPSQALHYAETRNYTEPLFVFVVMVIAGSRPILHAVQAVIQLGARLLPVEPQVATAWLGLAVVPLLGSLMTEPAAMTIAALMLAPVVFRTESWWLQPVVSALQPLPLFFGALGLTAITDNAALTYLGSQIEGISDAAKYMLVAGAVGGGGLTVIANAPNPAGLALLRRGFADESVGAGALFLGALAPTVVAAAAFLLL